MTTFGETYDRAELLACLDGDEQVVNEVIQLYLECAARTMSTISRELDRANSLAVADAAHSIKGALLTLRAHAAAATAKELEESSRRGDLASARIKFAALDAAARQLGAALDVPS